MSNRGNREETVRPEPEPAPAPPPRRNTRRERVRRALSSRPQLRDMVIVQELLEPPLGVRDGRF